MFKTNQYRYKIALPLIATSFFVFLPFTHYYPFENRPDTNSRIRRQAMPQQDIWQKTCQAAKLWSFSYNSKHFQLEVSPGDFLRLL